MPDDPESLTLFPRRARLAVNGCILLAAALFLALVTAMLWEDGKLLPAFLSLPACLAALAFSLARLLRAADPAPGLAIGPEGLWERIKPASYGLIPWDCVAGVSVIPRSSDLLMIHLASGHGLLAKLSGWKRLAHLLLYFGQSTIQVPVYFFDLPQSALKERIEAWLERAVATEEQPGWTHGLPVGLRPNSNGQIILQQNDRLLAFCGAVFLALGILILEKKPAHLFHLDSDFVQFYLILLFMTPFLLGWGVGLIHRGYFTRKPGLVLSPEGLREATWPGACGLIPWSDIASVQMEGKGMKILLRPNAACFAEMGWRTFLVHLFFYHGTRKIYLNPFLHSVRLLELKACLELYKERFSAA